MRWVCKGSATAELLLTVRGSSCQEREPGSANTNTQIAENKMCGRGLGCQSAARRERPLRLQRGRARASPEMPPGWSWAAPPGSGQEMMTMAGWQEWSPSSSLPGEILPGSLAAARPLSSHARSSGRDGGGTLNTCCCFGEVLVWRVIPAIKNYLQSTQKGRHTHVSPPTWGHCLSLPAAAATEQPCPGTAKRLRAAKAASSHARATPGEWRPPPVLGWTHLV